MNDVSESVTAVKARIRNGKPVPEMDIKQTDRFLSHVDRSGPNGCWEWTSTIAPNGYGRMFLDKQQYAAHRLSYRKFKGIIPDGFQIDHLCKNTKCVNPDHLEAVSRTENVHRSSATGMRKTCKRGHLLTPENCRPNRSCRICANARERGYSKGKRNVTPLDPHEGIFRTALAKWGHTTQIDMAVEEAAELIQALQHHRRCRCTNEDVAGEIADMTIMCGQMRLIFGADLVDAKVQEKLERLGRRLAA